MGRNVRLLQVILERSPRKLSQTRLLKFAYMTDVLACRVLGHPVSSFKYLRYKHGPFSPAFYRAKEKLLASGLAEVEEMTTRDGYDTSLIQSTVRDPAEPKDFSPGELYLIDYVISKFGNVALEEFLKERVYNTEPMQKANFGEELSMSEEKLKDADRLDGISLETILESRKAFDRGEGIPFEQVKRDILASFE